ncbi:MAG TPA: hypothetical protein VK148_19405 [Xanthobacteraceae bacterium]|nr:hypothetical protein [Xanthobacteraceae bacterium]
MADQLFDIGGNAPTATHRVARWQMRQAKPAMLTVAEVDMRASFGSRFVNGH